MDALKETRRLTPEKAEGLFLERLVELLLKQVEEEALAQASAEQHDETSKEKL